MALGDYAGRARVNRRSPSAQGECDRCGFVYQLDRLSKQFQWQGAALQYTGYIVCPSCLDIPFEQYKVLILPPDPVPRVDPRPSYNVTPMGYLPPNAGAPAQFATFPQNNPNYPSQMPYVPPPPATTSVFMLDINPNDILDGGSVLT